MLKFLEHSTDPNVEMTKHCLTRKLQKRFRLPLRKPNTATKSQTIRLQQTVKTKWRNGLNRHDFSDNWYCASLFPFDVQTNYSNIPELKKFKHQNYEYSAVVWRIVYAMIETMQTTNRWRCFVHAKSTTFQFC